MNTENITHAMEVFRGLHALLLTSELLTLRKDLERAVETNNPKVFYKIIKKAAKKAETRNP